MKKLSLRFSIASQFLSRVSPQSTLAEFDGLGYGLTLRSAVLPSIMKSATRYLVIAAATIVAVVVLVLWQRADREAALEELRIHFNAQVVERDNEFFIGCDGEALVDLVEFASLVKRVGEPTVIDLTGAPNLQSLDGFEGLTSVVSLVVIDCPNLESVDGVSSHPNLAELIVMDATKLRDASPIRRLPSLVTLDLTGSIALEEFDLVGLSALENLYLSRCRKLTSLDVSSLALLKQLFLDGASRIQSVTGLERLDQLTDFDISNASSLVGLKGVSGLSSLIVLDIRNVDVPDFSEIGQLVSLRVLRMGGQDSITSMEALSGLSSLKEIHLEACPNLSSIKGIPSSVSQYAGFTHCPKLETLSGIEVCDGLEQLDVTGCRNLKEIKQVSQLRSLVQFSLVKCRQVTDIAPVAGLAELTVVMLGGSGILPDSIEDIEMANPEIIFDFAVGE